jgi:hypothetical protein
VKPTILVGVKV